MNIPQVVLNRIQNQRIPFAEVMRRVKCLRARLDVASHRDGPAGFMASQLLLEVETIYRELKDELGLHRTVGAEGT